MVYVVCLQVGIGLTPDGLEHRDDVIETVYWYIHMLQV